MMISVIIPVHDQASRLRLTLAALERQEDISPSDYEVIVIDDDSSDEIDAVIESCRKAAPYVLFAAGCASRGARGIPRNMGVDMAHGDIILFIDADAMPGRRLLATHRDAHRTSDRICLGDIYVLPDTEFLANPADGTALANYQPENPLILPLDAVRRGIPDSGLLLRSQKGGYPGHAPWHQQLEELLNEGGVPFSWAGVIPHNLSISRETLERTGTFDVCLPHMEGWEFGIRAIRAGCVVGFAQGARSFHLFHYREPQAIHHDIDLAQAILMQRYPDALTDVVELWFHAALGDPYLAGESNLANWRAVWGSCADRERRQECHRLYSLSCRLRQALSASAYWPGVALNSPFFLTARHSEFRVGF